MSQGTVVEKFTGEVSVSWGGRKEKIDKTTKLNGRCEIETQAESYASVYDNPSPESGKKSSGVILFPYSKVVVYVERGFIKKFEIIKGLVNVRTPFMVITPVAEWQGMAWADVAPSGETVIAHSRDTFYNRKTHQAVTLDVNQQALITDDKVGNPTPMDQRFYQAQEMVYNLGAFAGAEIYQDVAESADKQLAAYLFTQEEMSKQTGQPFDQKARQETIQEFAKYKAWAGTEAVKSQRQAEEITKTNLAKPTTVPIDKNINYQEIALKINSIKIDPKADGKFLMSVNIDAKNESGKQIFVFWSEESRLINEKDEEFPTDDYNLESNFMPEAKASGYLYIPVDKKEDKYRLQFGKKSLSKVNLKINLAEDKKS